MISLGHVSSKEEDDAKEQYIRFLDEVVQNNQEKFKLFNKFENSLDTFYSQFLKEKDFVTLWKVFVLVFCLSHTQSQIERGFNTNKEFSVVNQSEFCLTALRTVQDHMQAKGISAVDINITKDLIKSIKLARQRYDEYAGKLKFEKRI